MVYSTLLGDHFSLKRIIYFITKSNDREHSWFIITPIGCVCDKCQMKPYQVGKLLGLEGKGYQCVHNDPWGQIYTIQSYFSITDKQTGERYLYMDRRGYIHTNGSNTTDGIHWQFIPR